MFNQVQHRYHYYQFIKLNAFLFQSILKKQNSKMKTQKFGFFSFFLAKLYFCYSQQILSQLRQRIKSKHASVLFVFIQIHSFSCPFNSGGSCVIAFSEPISFCSVTIILLNLKLEDKGIIRNHRSVWKTSSSKS